MSDEALVKFARWAVQKYAWAHDLDGGDVQEKAEELGLIRNVGFDPSKHKDTEGYGLEAGDPWYEFAGPLLGKASP